ncbi:MAG: GNAT family N-acetyltransferase [Phycisphaerales bacterium]|nr:GNAT family N-acetyltransferase [Phycisphaerales bacterium]
MSKSHVFICPPHRFADAAALLVGGGPSAGERFLAHARETGISLERLVCLGEPSGVLLGAALPIVAPGRTAMIATSSPTSIEKAESLALLIRHAADSVRTEVDLAQALVPPERTLEIHAFDRAGFSRLATLAYLERPMPRLFTPAVAELASGWSVESIDLSIAGAREEICAVLTRTYRDTLDCPELAGIRKTTDVLEGHVRAGGGARWWVMLRDAHGAAHGLALLNPAITDATSELVYFGLAPEARGKGLGIALLSRAIAAVTRERRGSVVLAMDTRNAPALKLYTQLGFRAVAERLALIRATAC